MRGANRSEEFFRYVAQQIGEPSLCAKIPWSVESPGGFFTDPSYDRSECYDFIAGRTKNPWLCWKVKRLGAFHPLESQTTMWSCLDHAFHGWNGGMAISQSDLVDFFQRMGYEPGTLPLAIPAANTASADQVYFTYDRFLDELQAGTDPQHMEARRLFIGRVQQLPDYN